MAKSKPIRRNVNTEQKPANEEEQVQNPNLENEVEKEVNETETEEVEEVVEEKPTKVQLVEVTTETMLKVKKLNGGALYLPKKILKPNETAWVKESDIPAAFMDSIQIIEKKEGKVVPVKKKIYAVEEQGDGTFSVVNTETKKAISKDLEAEEASSIAASLNAN